MKKLFIGLLLCIPLCMQANKKTISLHVITYEVEKI